MTKCPLQLTALQTLTLDQRSRTQQSRSHHGHLRRYPQCLECTGCGGPRTQIQNHTGECPTGKQKTNHVTRLYFSRARLASRLGETLEHVNSEGQASTQTCVN